MVRNKCLPVIKAHLPTQNSYFSLHLQNYKFENNAAALFSSRLFYEFCVLSVKFWADTLVTFENFHKGNTVSSAFLRISFFSSSVSAVRLGPCFKLHFVLTAAAKNSDSTPHTCLICYNLL